MKVVAVEANNRSVISKPLRSIDASMSCCRPSPFSILLVLPGRCLSKIYQTVVCAIAVPVVNLIFWPNAICVKPSKSVCIQRLTSNADHPIPDGLTNGARDAVRFDALNSYPPMKLAGFWVVGKKFTQAFCGKIRLSHDAPVQRIGERPRAISRRGWASLF